MKRAFLLSALADDTYKLVWNLCVPDAPNKKKYDDLIKLIRKQLTPVESHYAGR